MTVPTPDVDPTAKADQVGLWSCPDCAFTFDAAHTDMDGSYTCPACAEKHLQEQLTAAAEAFVEMHADINQRLDALALKLGVDHV